MNKGKLIYTSLMLLIFLMANRSFAQLIQPEWSKQAIVYEVNLRQYSEEGTIAKFAESLPRLKSMGVTVLWFMPLHPIGEKNRKGTKGSYYSVKDYYAISEEYGTEEDFKLLVKKAHELGMKVLIDWVANHTSWDNNWITSHPDWYAKDEKGEIVTQYDWTDVAKLDYTNKNLRAEMINAMKHWVRKMDIDGFRCDVAFLVPKDFWEEARESLEKVKPIYMLAEMEWNTDITDKPNQYFDMAFNAAYGWNFMGLTSDYASSKITLSDMKSGLKKNYASFPKHTHKLLFLTNHDENSWNGTIDEKYGNNWQQFGVMVYTLPQTLPLIYSGEEIGLTRRLSFFEKDNIHNGEWSNTDNIEWYTQMTDLRKSVKAFNSNSGDTTLNDLDLIIKSGDANSVMAYKRNSNAGDAYVFINFANSKTKFSVKQFKKISFLKDYKMNANASQKITKKTLSLAPNSYIIFYK